FARHRSLSAPEPPESPVARAMPSTAPSEPAEEPDEEALRLVREHDQARRLEEEQAQKLAKEEDDRKREAFVRKVPGTLAVKTTGHNKVNTVPAAPPPPDGIFTPPAANRDAGPAP